MRIAIRIGLVPDSKALSITAAASEPDASQARPERWFHANVSLEALAAVLGVAITLYGIHVDSTRRMQEELRTQAELTTKVAEQEKKLDLLSNKRVPDLMTELQHNTVSRAEYEHDTTQLNLTLTQLETGQQQIYNLLVERRGK